MKNSERNLAVIENFILFLTHCSDEKEPAFKEPQTYTPEELYRVAFDYIEEDHVDGKGNPDDDKQEMFVVYKTDEVEGKGYVDDYHVVESQDLAKAKLKEFKKEPNLFTAGYAKIIDSTDHV